MAKVFIGAFVIPTLLLFPLFFSRFTEKAETKNWIPLVHFLKLVMLSAVIQFFVGYVTDPAIPTLQNSSLLPIRFLISIAIGFAYISLFTNDQKGRLWSASALAVFSPMVIYFVFSKLTHVCNQGGGPFGRSVCASETFNAANILLGLSAQVGLLMLTTPKKNYWTAISSSGILAIVLCIYFIV